MTIEIAPIAPEAKRPAATDANKSADKFEPNKRSEGGGEKAFAKTLADAGAQVESGKDSEGEAKKQMGTVASNDTALPTDAVVDSGAQAAALLAQMAQAQASQTASTDILPSGDAAAKVALNSGRGAPAANAVAAAIEQSLQGKAGEGSQDMARTAALKRADLASNTSPSDASPTAQTGTSQKPDERLAKFFSTFSMERALHDSADALATVSPVTVGADKQQGERSLFKSAMSEAGNSSAGQDAFDPNITYEVMQAEPATPTDNFIGEKVAYWIANDVQNAEMTLDGMGGDKVEVSIRMQGNEAQVAFRSDELQTREALQHASAHLKDMLLREGLVLSGVSVGTAGAGQQNEDRQQNNERPNVKKMTIANVQLPLGPAGRLGAPAGGRAVDLFV
jgi:flagellar hook-length control protein FliK